jgi:hypothetical protein
MSAVSNLASQIGGYREIATLNTTLCPPDEAIVRKTERAQPFFVETIVGRHGGLCSILTEAEAVAPCPWTAPASTIRAMSKGAARVQVY